VSGATPDLEPQEVAALRADYDLAFHEPPTEAAPSEAERECDRLLLALASVREEIAANKRVHDADADRVAQWFNRVNASPVRQEAWLLDMIEHVAQFVPTFGKKKSRDLPHGVIGWRKNPERIVVEDEAAALAWAKARGLPVKTAETVAVPDLTRAWKEVRPTQEPGWLPPGCKLVGAEEVFHADPKGVA
jgi:hypothetical protein